jgi:two-component system, NarL family, response regulator DesR
MIQVLLAQRWTLDRKALAARLSQEEDIEVVAEIADRDELLQAAERRLAPHVIVADLDILGTDEVSSPSTLSRLPADSRLLVLMDSTKSSVIADALPEQASRLGFVSKDKPPTELAASVRQAAKGEPVLDPDLAVAALAALAASAASAVDDNRLTSQEQAILALAAEGMPVKDIASRLFLASGTVRNYLSRINSKTGAHSRMEAIRVARDAGWL